MLSENATDRKFDELDKLTTELSRYVHEAACEGRAIHAVEREIWTRVQELGRQALGRFIADQGDGDVGETFTMPDGRVLKRLDEPHTRVYQSIFGRYELNRAVYGTWEGQKIEFVPLDQRLQLPQSEFSYVLQDWDQVLGVEQAFSRVNETMGMILGFNQSVDSLERMNRQMARTVESFRSSRPTPRVEEEGKIMVVTADNKGIPMRRPADQRPVGSHRKKGEKANKKQMATVGAVYTVDPKVRTAEEVVAALFHDEPQKKRKDQPVAQHKRVWSSLSIERDGDVRRGQDEVFHWMAEEQARRNPAGEKDIVCVMDGQSSLWEDRRRHLPLDNVVDILDLLHVTPRLWEAAYLFHREGSDKASAFVRQRLLGILRGQVGYCVGGLRQMGTKGRLRGPKAKKLRQICNYLEKNRSRMCYDEYLAAGYPIASGVIEGACRYVVKDRMERAGMRWTVEGAQAMLDLRSTYVNGQWEEFQNYRITQENLRLYPHQAAMQCVDWPLAA
ncbi:MAG: ISKra4 family transposase [Phycisphaerae bacterium]